VKQEVVQTKYYITIILYQDKIDSA